MQIAMHSGNNCWSVFWWEKVSRLSMGGLTNLGWVAERKGCPKTQVYKSIIYHLIMHPQWAALILERAHQQPHHISIKLQGTTTGMPQK